MRRLILVFLVVGLLTLASSVPVASAFNPQPEPPAMPPDAHAQMDYLFPSFVGDPGDNLVVQGIGAQAQFNPKRNGGR